MEPLWEKRSAPASGYLAEASVGLLWDYRWAGRWAASKADLTAVPSELSSDELSALQWDFLAEEWADWW